MPPLVSVARPAAETVASRDPRYGAMSHPTRSHWLDPVDVVVVVAPVPISELLEPEVATVSTWRVESGALASDAT